MTLTKVSGGILDPGISVAGIVTATGFDGPFIGGSSKNVVAGIITATGFDLNGNGDISGNLVIGGNLTANGDFTTLNTTLREVEILRVDANSSVAAGIITQRGSGNILEFFDTSSNVGALTDEGNLGLGANLTSPNVKLHVKSTATGGGNIAYFDDTGSGNTGRLMILTTGGAATDGVKLQAVNRKYIHFGNATNQLTIDNNNSRVGIGSDIPDYPLDVIGSIGFSGQTRAASGSQGAPSYSFDGDSDTGMYRGGVNILSFATAGSEALRIHADGEVAIAAAANGQTVLSCLGAYASSSTVDIQTWARSDSAVKAAMKYSHGTNSMNFGTTTNHPLIFQVNNTERIRIDSDGNILLKDAAGQGNSLVHYIRANDSSGNSQYQLGMVSSGNEDLYLVQSRNANLRFQTSGSSRWLIDGDPGHLLPAVAGAVNIGSASAEIGNVYIADDKRVYFGTDQDLSIYSSGSNSFFENSVGHTYFRNSSGTSGGLLFRSDGETHISNYAANEYRIKTFNQGAVELYYNSAIVLRTQVNHLEIYGNTAESNIEFLTNPSSPLVRGLIGVTNNGTMSFYTNDGTQRMAVQLVPNGAVLLKHGTSTKFETTLTGITVTGEVAATQDYPLVKPVLDFNFAATKTLDPRFKFTRAGTGTFVDKKGIVQYASHNQPRFDHHPTSGVSLGLLLEQQSINYQPYSVDMSQGANNNEVTVENNAAISPDGTMNASKITGGTNQSTSQRLGWGTQGVNTSNYTMWSIWLKSEETSCIIQVYSNTYTFGADHLNIELADGTTGGHSGEFGDTTFRYHLEKYPNKWWRLSWGGNGNSGGSSGGMYVAVVPAMNSARAANTGAAHSKVWYAWGLQEEVGTGSKFATSYIPTYGNSSTRAADRGTIDGDDFDDFFDRYQGAVVHEISNAINSWTQGGCGWEFNNDNYQYNVISNLGSGYSHNAYPGGYAVIHGESSDSGTNSMSQFSSNSATGNQGYNNGYYAGRYPSTSVVDYNRLYKTYTDGMSWDISGSTNTLIAATGGFSETGTNTNTISHRNISKFELGSDATDMDASYQKFSGRIKRWMYYDKALTANQLVNLTAQDPVTYL